MESPLSPCREYQGHRHPDGYGYVPFGAKRFKASGASNGRRLVLLHRWVVEQVEGRSLASSEVVRHRCDNPPCFLYEHLIVGSQADNVEDMVVRGRSRRAEQHWNWKGGASRNFRLGRNRSRVL